MICFNFVPFLVVAFLMSAKADDGSEDKVSCVNEIVEWCIKQNFDGIGSNIVSTGDTDEQGRYRQIYCISNSHGTNCYADNEPWYSCSFDHKAKYKGTVLQKDSSDGADDEICYTAKKTNSSSYTYNSEKTRKIVQKSMTKLKDDLSHVFRECFPFCDHNPFGRGFPFN